MDERAYWGNTVVGIRIFIEGGGDSEITKSKLRKGFSTFLKPLVDLIRQNKNTIAWRGVVPCGRRTAAYRDFCIALKQFPNDLNILLVDSEESLPEKCSDPKRRNWEHLAKREGDQWECPVGIDDSQCFLMIECMETWLVADRAALVKFYGKELNEKALPANRNLESVPKHTIADALKQATKKTQKGEYHKINHAFEIMELLNVATVRSAVPSCERLFAELETRIGIS